MTREEEIKLLVQHLAKVWYAGANSNLEALFEQAVQWADEHPNNPWISVNDRLPNVGEMVLVNVHHTIDGGGEHHEDDQILVDKFNGTWSCNWCKQERMGVYLFDMISKTTHWMPIPELKKGE